MSEVLAAVWVAGIPRTKGSLDARHQDTPQSKRWRYLVAQEVARDSYARSADGKTLRHTVGPVAVRCVFVRADGVGDVDKLARCVLDALTDSRVIVDDVQVVRLHCWRTERVEGRGDGAFILVEVAGPGDPVVAGQFIDVWVPR